jgi:hypothetical protein
MMPAGWYADIENAKALARRLRDSEDEQGALVVETLLMELGKFRRGEQPSEIEIEAKKLPESRTDKDHKHREG